MKVIYKCLEQELNEETFKSMKTFMLCNTWSHVKGVILFLNKNKEASILSLQ